MKKLVLFCFSAVCALTFIFSGCDDGGLTCLAGCQVDYEADMDACYADQGRATGLTCEQQYDPTRAACVIECNSTE